MNVSKVKTLAEVTETKITLRSDDSTAMSLPAFSPACLLQSQALDLQPHLGLLSTLSSPGPCHLPACLPACSHPVVPMDELDCDSSWGAPCPCSCPTLVGCLAWQDNLSPTTHLTPIHGSNPRPSWLAPFGFTDKERTQWSLDTWIQRTMHFFGVSMFEWFTSLQAYE